MSGACDQCGDASIDLYCPDCVRTDHHDTIAAARGSDVGVGMVRHEGGFEDVLMVRVRVDANALRRLRAGKVQYIEALINEASEAMRRELILKTSFAPTAMGTP